MSDSKQKQKSQPQRFSGRCLCGSVKFEVEGPLRDVVSCYCSECRQTSGNFVSATGVPDSRLTILEASGLTWYKNELAQRGFCQHCGGNLFWRPEPSDNKTRIMAGCLDPANGLKIKAQLFVDSKSDFHEISDAAPQYSDGKHQIATPD